MSSLTVLLGFEDYTGFPMRIQYIASRANVQELYHARCVGLLTGLPRHYRGSQ